MDIEEVLRRAWQITWRFKGLWVLGILAGCGGGGGGGGSSRGSGRGLPFQVGEGAFPARQRFLLAGVRGQSGLISGFDLADEGHAVTLSVAFQRSLHYFWKILGAQVLLWLLAAAVLAAIFITGGILTLGTFGLALLCLLPLVCLLIPALLLFGVYVMITQVALVVEELDLGAAFSRSWQVMRDNLGNVILLGIALVVGGAVIGILLFVPFLALAAPALAGIAP